MTFIIYLSELMCWYGSVRVALVEGCQVCILSLSLSLFLFPCQFVLLLLVHHIQIYDRLCLSDTMACALTVSEVIKLKFLTII